MAIVNEPHDDLTGARDTAPHKEADDTEQIYFQGSPMLRSELAKGWYWVLVGLGVISIPIVIRLMSKSGSNEFAWWWFAVAAVLGIIFIFVPWIITKTVSYKISNYRIDVERGLVSRSIDTLELWHVNDVRMNQSFLERLLGVGTLTIYSGDDTTPTLPLRGLPNPRSIFEAIKQRIIAVKRQRGVVKMDIG